MVNHQEKGFLKMSCIPFEVTMNIVLMHDRPVFLRQSIIQDSDGKGFKRKRYSCGNRTGKYIS